MGLVRGAIGWDALPDEAICNFDEFFDLFQGENSFTADFLKFWVAPSVDSISESIRLNP